VDQATIVGYAFGYIATIIAIFLIFLPHLIILALLLLLASAVQLVVLLLKAITVGVFRILVRLFWSIADRLPRGQGGDELVPH
jgi:chromate transport protein ChrA